MFKHYIRYYIRIYIENKGEQTETEEHSDNQIKFRSDYSDRYGDGGGGV